MDKYNLNEHSTARTVFRVLGPIFVGLGILLVASAVGSFFGFGFGTFGLSFVGIPFLFLGALFTVLGYGGALARYQASQVAPVTKDVVNYMVDNTKDSMSGAVASFAQAVHSQTPTEVKCPSCGEIAHPGATFCDRCGRPLFRTCPKCHERNDADATFCQKCGTRL